MQFWTAKSLAIVFGLVSTAFCIATIVLAVQKADLANDLQNALDRLDLTTSTSTPTTTLSTSGTTMPSESTLPTFPTMPSETTGETTVTIISTSSTHSEIPTEPTTVTTETTTTTEGAVFPTLPPNLTDPEKVLYRLPTDIRPIKYSIQYTPNLEERTFEGQVSIQIRVDNATNLIAMHSKGLQLDGVSILQMMSRMRIRVKKYHVNDTRQLLMIELEELLLKNTEYFVSLSYSGKMHELTGMYASSYINEDNENRHHSAHRKVNATLFGFCLFLLVLCLFLLGALVYVGHSLANDKSGGTAVYRVNESSLISEDIKEKSQQQETLTKLIRLRATINQPPQNSIQTKIQSAIISPMAAKSKILQHLSYRLPSQVKPLKYNLSLHPDLKKKKFFGNITISLEINKPISYIPLHSKFLNVSTQGIERVDNNGKHIKRIEPLLTYEFKDYEYWVTEFEEPLEAGNYSMNLTFDGSLTDRIVGFYQSSYLNEKTNEKRWIATSKFEPTYARQAFPCFDEPEMKATFEITIAIPTGDGYSALSNMNVVDKIEMEDKTLVNFAESVPMSTYLACFIVSDFQYKTKMIRGILNGAKDFELRVYSTPAQVDKVDYALQLGVGITEYYIKYFNIAYPLPKLDMAAIPDFVSGATEHWGLVTFRETALLYDEKISSSQNKQRVATVVAHELAHMWFGNLVTMKWWNDLWLNEGFASYMEYKGVNEVHPEWGVLHHFIIEDMHSVLILDATLASHPIVQTVESPDQITELFDQITYAKGSSIVRMLEDLVGEEEFRKGVSSYLSRHMYKNAETEDFLSEFDSLELNFDVKLILQTWTVQMGLPVVEVTKNGDTYKLTQKRFFSNPKDYEGTYDDSEFNYHWSIPITYFTSANSSVQRKIFNYNDNELTITVSEPIEYIKFNKDQKGYYRVNYPVEMWRDLIKALTNNPSVFSISDRGHLINDAFSLADAGQLEYDVALDLTSYLEKELDYVPWSVAISHLSTVKNLLYYTDLYRDFVIYGRKIMLKAYESVSWDVGTDHSYNLLHITIISAACSYGHREALQEAAERFQKWLSKPEERPSPDIRSTVYYYGMQEIGNETIWNQVFDLFIAEQDAQEKLKLMSALTAVKEPWILQRFINLAWNESNVRGQDYFTCLQTIAVNPIGQSLVWDYVRENWTTLVDRFGINERYLGRLIPSITRRFTTQTKLKEMLAFFSQYPEAGAGAAARKQAEANLRNKIEWLHQNKEKVGKWLEKNSLRTV